MFATLRPPPPLCAEDGRYYARFPTRVNAYSTVRLPYNAFRAAQQGLPAIKPEAIKHIAIRCGCPLKLQGTAGNGCR